MAHEEDVLNLTRRLAEVLAPGDLDETLERVTTAAVDVLPGVSYASISIRHADGDLETVVPTDDLLLDIDAVQYHLREGPCYETATTKAHVTAANLADDPRFPRYAPLALSAGIYGQAAVQLFAAKRSNGALNLYSTEPGAFQDVGALADLFARQSGQALQYARQITQLSEAVETREVIGQAVGIVMERYDLDEARSFGFLARISQDNNIKLRVVADRLIAETHARLS